METRGQQDLDTEQPIKLESIFIVYSQNKDSDSLHIQAPFLQILIW